MSTSNFRIQELDRRTLSWWKNRRDRIDMDPTYQRKGRRWSKSDKQYLIDSIINGFDVPKFYLSDFTWGPSELNTNSSAYAVIDGKQRFEAIFDFFDGKISLAPDFKYIQNPQINAAGMTLEQLRLQFPALAEDFENFNPIMMGVVTSDKRFIEELFLRLNRSRPLKGAEVRNAMPGPVPEMVRQITNHQFFISNSSFPKGAGQDLNLAAKLLMFEHLGILENTKKDNLDRFTSAPPLLTENSLSRSFEIVCETLDAMSEIFVFEDKLLGSEGAIPVYYWFVRNTPIENHWAIRDFLETFLNWLGSKDKVSTLPPDLISDLEIYSRALRSINDKFSHEKRFELLNQWFSKWIFDLRH